MLKWIERLLSRNAQEGLAPVAALSRPPLFSENRLVVDYFRESPRQGVMVDVGALSGNTFKPFLQMGWKVYAFEPDPAKRAQLKRYEEDDRVRLFYSAVSDEASEAAPFFVSDESIGISSLSPFRDSHREIGTVAVTTLDRMVESEGLDRIDYLKVDAEGYDLQVLRGVPWERLTPAVVLCEFEDFKTLRLGYDVHTLGRFLVERGYQVYISEWKPIVAYGARHEWSSIRPYPCELEDQRAWGNFLAVAPGENTAAMRRLVEATRNG